MAYVKKKTLANRLRQYEKNRAPTIAAYEIYKTETKYRNRRAVADMHKFIAIKSYTSYLNFAKFMHVVHVSNTDLYIRAMLFYNRKVNTWTNDYSYRLYLEYIDEQQPPLDAITETVNVLFDMSELVELPVDKLMHELHFSEIMKRV